MWLAQPKVIVFRVRNVSVASTYRTLGSVRRSMGFSGRDDHFLAWRWRTAHKNAQYSGTNKICSRDNLRLFIRCKLLFSILSCVYFFLSKSSSAKANKLNQYKHKTRPTKTMPATATTTIEKVAGSWVVVDECVVFVNSVALEWAFVISYEINAYSGLFRRRQPLCHIFSLIRVRSACVD